MILNGLIVEPPAPVSIENSSPVPILAASVVNLNRSSVLVSVPQLNRVVVVPIERERSVLFEGFCKSFHLGWTVPAEPRQNPPGVRKQPPLNEMPLANVEVAVVEVALIQPTVGEVVPTCLVPSKAMRELVGKEVALVPPLAILNVPAQVGVKV